MTETETEAGAKTRQGVTRQGKTRQDDFAAYADAAARCCKNDSDSYVEVGEEGRYSSK